MESIQANEAGFLVKSSDSGNTYQVTLQPNVCCSCPDWKRFHWPCKHILNVVVQEPNVEWESLSASFTRQPWFILDTFGEESTQTLQTDLPRQEITEPEADQESIPDSISSQPCFSLDASFGEDQNSQAEPAAQANPAEPQETVDLVAPVTETSFIEVPESDTIERSSTIQRRFCLEIMKNIQNSLYIVDNPDILYQAHNSLAEISRLLDENTPKLCNLPLWTKRGRRKRNIHKQPKSSHRTPPVGHKLTTRHETALKKARLRLATARSRPQASTTSSNEDYIQCGAPPNECLDGKICLKNNHI